MVPNTLRTVGELAAVHQVNVTSDVSGRVTDVLFTAGSHVTKGQPLVQLFDKPDQGDLASYKAQAKVAELSLDRAQQLATRQFGPQATVDQAQAAFDQANAGIAKTEAIISQKLVRAPFDGVISAVFANAGAVVSAGERVVQLSAQDGIEAVIDQPEAVISRVRIGAPYEAVKVAGDLVAEFEGSGYFHQVEPRTDAAGQRLIIEMQVREATPPLSPDA